jgi:hypothetical protein
MTMAADLTHPTIESGSCARLAKLIYASLFLIATSGLFYVLMTNYDVHLVRVKQFELASTVEENLALAESLFFFIQLLPISVNSAVPDHAIWA